MSTLFNNIIYGVYYDYHVCFFAMLANADDWVDMEVFGKKHEPFLRNYLELPNGISSHDTPQKVFAEEMGSMR